MARDEEPKIIGRGESEGIKRVRDMENPLWTTADDAELKRLGGIVKISGEQTRIRAKRLESIDTKIAEIEKTAKANNATLNLQALEAEKLRLIAERDRMKLAENEAMDTAQALLDKKERARAQQQPASEPPAAEPEAETPAAETPPPPRIVPPPETREEDREALRTLQRELKNRDTEATPPEAPGPSETPTYAERRSAFFDRQYNADNPDYASPVIPLTEERAEAERREQEQQRNAKQLERDRAITELRATVAAATAGLVEINAQLAELRRKKKMARLTETRKEPDEETSAEIEAKIDSLNTELDRLREKIREKTDDLNSAGVFTRTKPIRKEIDALRELYRKKSTEMGELADRIGGVYDREREEAERRREAERLEQERKEAERLERERVRAIEADKKINPFKYFLIENMHDAAFRCLFLRRKEEVSLEMINAILGESGKEIKYFLFNNTEPRRADTAYFSTNGFFLHLTNRAEVQKTNGDAKSDDPRARYQLTYPNWTYIEADLTYEEGVTLLRQRAQEYQAQKLDEFEKERGNK